MKTGFQIIWMDEVDSTNNELKRRFFSIDNLSVIAAYHQTAGRGQRGNKWLSRDGENLTFSVFVKPGHDGVPEIAATDQFAISQAATLAVAEMLESKGINAAVKWPNDIYVGDRKICGMLIENTLDGEKVVASIVGIGINVNQEQFSPELMNPCSMRTVTKESYDIKCCLEEFLELFQKYIFSDDNSSIKEKYLSKLYRLNEFHSYNDILEKMTFNGRITGISDDARLIVEKPDGSRKEFAFKEIGYIL